MSVADSDPDDLDYLQAVLPVLLSYTEQVVFAVDLDRLVEVASRHGAHEPAWRFLNAMQTFRDNVELIEGP